MKNFYDRASYIHERKEALSPAYHEEIKRLMERIGSLVSSPDDGIAMTLLLYQSFLISKLTAQNNNDLATTLFKTMMPAIEESCRRNVAEFQTQAYFDNLRKKG